MDFDCRYKSYQSEQSHFHFHLQSGGNKPGTGGRHHAVPIRHTCGCKNPVFPNGTRESPYPAIQEGIDNSGGDIIYVHPGTYPGDIAPGKTRGGVTLKDSVSILGAGADSTILAGAVNAEGASGASISGFKIENGIPAIFLLTVSTQLCDH